MKLFGHAYTRQEILRKVGSISQIGGIRTYTLNDGASSGVKAIDIHNGNGMLFTILPDRGLDISRFSYHGASLCWHSSTGEVHPSFYEADEFNWLRTFYGGFLVTCGLTHMGLPDEDGGVKLGLHGRYSNT